MMGRRGWRDEVEGLLIASLNLGEAFMLQKRGVPDPTGDQFLGKS